MFFFYLLNLNQTFFFDMKHYLYFKNIAKIKYLGINHFQCKDFKYWWNNNSTRIQFISYRLSHRDLPITWSDISSLNRVNQILFWFQDLQGKKDLFYISLVLINVFLKKLKIHFWIYVIRNLKSLEMDLF